MLLRRVLLLAFLLKLAQLLGVVKGDVYLSVGVGGLVPRRLRVGDGVCRCVVHIGQEVVEHGTLRTLPMVGSDDLGLLQLVFPRSSLKGAHLLL